MPSSAAARGSATSVLSRAWSLRDGVARANRQPEHHPRRGAGSARRLFRDHAAQRAERDPGPRLHDGSAIGARGGAGSHLRPVTASISRIAVRLGRNVIIGGRNSSLWTHNRQETAPIEIGDFCYLGSEVRLAPGAKLPEECILGIGAVLVGEIREPRSLVAGVPAKDGAAARREGPRQDPPQDARRYARRLLQAFLSFSYPLAREALPGRLSAGRHCDSLRPAGPDQRTSRVGAARRRASAQGCFGWAASTSPRTSTSAISVSTRTSSTPKRTARPTSRRAAVRASRSFDPSASKAASASTALSTTCISPRPSRSVVSTASEPASLDLRGVKTRFVVEERYERNFYRPNYEVNERVEQEKEGTRALLRRDLGDRMRRRAVRRALADAHREPGLPGNGPR